MAEIERVANLNNGRRLAFLEAGNDTGNPVLYLHGNPGSRRERQSYEALYKQQNMRFIAVNRPGIGGSSLYAGWTPSSYADDLNELLGQLQIQQPITLMGYSAGGLYACAFASKYPEVVGKLVLVSSVSPYDDDYLYGKLSDANRMYFDAARDNPDGLAQQLSAITEPEAIFATIESMVTEEDRHVMSLPHVRNDLLAAYSDMLIQGMRPIVQDLAHIAVPWGFSLSAIQADTRLWHGRLDMNSPIESCEYLADRIPTTKKIVFDNEGHYFSYARWEEIIRTI